MTQLVNARAGIQSQVYLVPKLDPFTLRQCCGLKMLLNDFPGGPVVKNLPYNAGDEGSPLVRELRSHAVGLSAHAPTTEPVGHS